MFLKHKGRGALLAYDVNVISLAAKLEDRLLLSDGVEVIEGVPPIHAYKSGGYVPKAHGWASISSVDALSGDDKPQDAYGASKAAMIRLSKSLAVQFAKYNIRSNTILPGAVDTPMQNRWKKNPLAKKQLSKNKL